jgi:hypothetical protein
MEEFPDEGSDIVEELEGVVGTFGIDGTGTEEELEVGVDLFGRCEETRYAGSRVNVPPVTMLTGCARGRRWFAEHCYKWYARYRPAIT